MDNNFEINANREYILCGDISASMRTIDNKCGGNTRYKYMIEKFQSFVEKAAEFDPHGGTVILFGEEIYVFPETTLDKLTKENVFENPTFEGFTNIHLAIEAAYKIHRNMKVELAGEGKIHPGTVCMIFTDGEPSNRLAVEKAIVKIANEIDREDEFSIIFLTVGTVNTELKQYLDGLHDNLEDKLERDFDIFHVKELDQVSFLKAVGSQVHG